jgi:hypothetical protein
MSLLLRMLQSYTPVVLRRRELEQLVHLTAAAFGAAAPDGRWLSFRQRLEQYARFTNAQALKSVQGGDLAGRREALFQSGLAMGKRLRKLCRAATRNDAQEAMRLVYGCIGIDVRFHGPDTLRVHRCFFSDFYTPETCAVISALDDGVFAGLSGGGRLTFTGRITEGLKNCTAETRWEEGAA